MSVVVDPTSRIMAGPAGAKRAVLVGEPAQEGPGHPVLHARTARSRVPLFGSAQEAAPFRRTVDPLGGSGETEVDEKVVEPLVPGGIHLTEEDVRSVVLTGRPAPDMESDDLLGQSRLTLGLPGRHEPLEAGYREAA